jgi:hypothetical protein
VLILAACAGLALVLALWPLSYATGRALFVDTGSRNLSLAFWRGKITAAAWNTPSKGSFNVGWGGRSWAWDSYDNLWLGSDTRWHFVGFDGGNSAAFGTFLSIPFWFLSLSLAAPLLWLALRARGRTLSARCPSCAYDMRATPDRCPGCGEVAAVRPPNNPPLERTGPAV